MTFNKYAVWALLSVAAVAGCSSSRNGSNNEIAKDGTRNHINGGRGPVISAGDIQTAEIEKLDNGAEIVIQNLGGTLYHEVEATFAPDSYRALQASIASRPQAERVSILRKEIQKSLKSIRTQAKVIPMAEIPEAGYFSFLLPYTPELLSALKAVKFDRGMLFNPVVYDRGSLKEVKSQTPRAEGLLPRSDARESNDSYSGLKRIGAVEFVRLAQQQIGGGATVNGSSVNLGITDTGITYNHPTFLSGLNSSRNRITYMRDFTREGRIYFHPKAKFEVSVPEDSGADTLLLTAEVLVSPRLPAVPAGDNLVEIKDQLIQVSPALRAVLTTPGSGAKLGVLSEDAFQADGEPVDLNANGKMDDQLLAILIPGKTALEDVLYLDSSGTGDFRKSSPIGNFNTTHQTAKVFAEQMAFDFREDKLPNAAGTDTIEVRSASLVGFDPGNHGSHVAGIAGGLKTVANDDELTLARGVAPEAKLLMNRVCANNGGCNATAAFVDLVVSGKAEVVNMSLGGLSPFNDGYGVQETMINRLTQLNNALFVISAGNSGPGRQTIGSPSTARLSLSVGATASRALIERQYQWPGLGSSDALTSEEDRDFMLFFSSRGPTASGGFKPSLSAPGTELSAIQLNSAPGMAAGLDVYWGTSMAAPTATGAYALLLDAIKKYNLAHPDRPLATDVLVLRQLLIDTARPFDVNTYDPATGKRTAGQYTWIDQGTGMIDLVAAWKRLFELRDQSVPTAVRLGGKPVELDYEVLVSGTGPNGIPYNGSQSRGEKTPAFGSGLYLDYFGTETLRQVHISRRLPENLAISEDAGDLTQQLVTTGDEFVLKTVIHGSDKAWLKAGVRDQLNCMDSETARLEILRRGAEVQVKEDGTGSIVGFGASTLNVCLDREMIASALPAGDHGALIYAYRAVGSQVATVPSFVVPVYLTVPHKTLLGASAYEVEGKVNSFGVNRGYVMIPKGTSVVQVTLEVPALKLTADGRVAKGQDCSGVELMVLEGINNSKSFASRAAARVMNCEAEGTPSSDQKRKLVLMRTNPNPGMWDLHVFGLYKYAKSQYKLRVDFVTATSSLAKIQGGLEALNGSLTWTVKDASMSIAPDAEKSTHELSGLLASTQAKVASGSRLVVESPLGTNRRYPTGTKEVTVTTGGSPGNDIDLAVLECSLNAEGQVDAASCALAGSSGGAADDEKVTFKPKAGKAYQVLVDGYDVQDDGKFVSTESIVFEGEKGAIQISGQSPVFKIDFSVGADQLGSSPLANHPLFRSGKYALTGGLTLRAASGMVLDSVPLEIVAPEQIAGDL